MDDDSKNKNENYKNALEGLAIFENNSPKKKDTGIVRTETRVHLSGAVRRRIKKLRMRKERAGTIGPHQNQNTQPIHRREAS